MPLKVTLHTGSEKCPEAKVEPDVVRPQAKSINLTCTLKTFALSCSNHFMVYGEMELLQEIVKYVREATGIPAEFKAATASRLSKLPLYLSHGYRFYELIFLNRSILLAISNEKTKVELSQLARDREQIIEILQQDVVLALPPIRSYERKRLFEKQIPFIVPGRQMFLPMLGIDFRESFPSPPVEVKTLSWVGQVLLLRHLLFDDIMRRPLGKVASSLAYSSMAISQAVDQLLALDLCRRIPEGRIKTVVFDDAGPVLWKKSVAYMRSPVLRRYSIKWLDPQKVFPLHANISALAQQTMIAPESKPVAALSDKMIRDLLAHGDMIACPFEEDAMMIMEGWAYRPEILANSPSVDPLSLFLSLREEKDERVQMALDQILERWT